MVAEAELVVRLVVAALLGSIIGIERELHGKPAGMRTHALVCLGSCLFALVSVMIAGGSVDPTRIAAGVVTGIGFLGAGTIFMAKDKIHGLTTAAEMWVLAAIGIAVGTGFYVVALATTALVFLLLVPGKLLEKKVVRRA
ncbi:MAG: MgtC/SapB family protein [Candidatus Aenigmarchaeota archaeon]|nr:MgtC/SapB family protein [Candidatus Aenigmarchaeota archaeon]